MVEKIIKELINYVNNNQNYSMDDIFKKFKLLYDCIISHTGCVKEEDGSITVTPVLGEFPYMDELCKYVEKNLTQDKITPSVELLEIINNFLYQKNTIEIEILKNAKINNYYGTVDYIKERTEKIIDAIAVLYNDTRTLENEKSVIETYMNDINSIYDSINSYSGTKESYLNDVSKPFERLLAYEKELTKIVSKRYQEFAAYNDAKLIHFLSDDYVLSDNMNKICTSLFNDKLKGHVCSFRHTGYLYDFNFDNIFAVGAEDLGSWVISKEEFIGISPDWRNQVYTPMKLYAQWDNETNCYFESADHTLLTLPENVEAEAIEKNVTYTEIYVNNKNKKLKPTACFYTEDATKEEIDKIEELARMQNIKVVPINIKSNVKR